MITEFSRVYVQLGKATEQSRMLSRNSSEALGSSLMESSFSSIKEDLAANCVTAHNSMLASESDCQASEQERSFTRTSYTLLVERDSTNWLDRSS